MFSIVLTAINSNGGSFTQNLEFLHDVEVAINAINNLNEVLSDESKFHGSVNKVFADNHCEEIATF